MVNKILLFRIGTAFAMAGISFLVSLLPALIHEMSYTLFDTTRVAACASLLAIGTIYQFNRSCQILDTYQVSFVCITMSTTLISAIFLEMLFAKKFDGMVQRYSGVVSAFVLRGLDVSQLTEGYRPVSTLEMHEFSLDTSVDTSIEQNEEEGVETDELLDDSDWGAGSFPRPGGSAASSLAAGGGKKTLKEMRDVQLGAPGDGAGTYSPLLCFMLVLVVDVFNATIEGISLGSRRHDDYSSLVSIIFRQLIVSFAFGATMETLEFGSISLVLAVLLYSVAVPLGIFIALLSSFRMNSLFCGLVAAVNSGLLLHFALFHMLPKDLVTNFDASANSRFKLLGFLFGYVIVVMGILYFPMQI
jgi:hypothetical protein